MFLESRWYLVLFHFVDYSRICGCGDIVLGSKYLAVNMLWLDFNPRLHFSWQIFVWQSNSIIISFHLYWNCADGICRKNCTCCGMCKYLHMPQHVQFFVANLISTILIENMCKVFVVVRNLIPTKWMCHEIWIMRGKSLVVWPPVYWSQTDIGTQQIGTFYRLWYIPKDKHMSSIISI